MCLFYVSVDINGGRGYLEARTLDHKAAKLVGGLGQLLVLVAPIQGLSEAPWGKEFLKVSDSVGVKLSEGRRGSLPPTSLRGMVREGYFRVRVLRVAQWHRSHRRSHFSWHESNQLELDD